ncbi:hypothetical protein JCM8097_003295 [Rhodosporidiobolus ruineniae]
MLEPTIPLIVGSVALALVTVWLVRVAAVLNSTRGQPGFVSLFPPLAQWPMLIVGQGHGPRVLVGRKTLWRDKADLFRKYNSTILVVVSLFPPQATVLVGDGKVIHHINASRKSFTKPQGVNAKVLWYFGHNLLTADGDEWRRHRRIAVSSFSEANTAKVWEASVKVADEWGAMLAEQEKEGKTIVKGVDDFFGPLFLRIIGEAAFGLDFPLPSANTASNLAVSSGNGQTFSFAEANKIVLREGVLTAVLPPWAMRLSVPKITRVRTGFEQFEGHLKKILSDRREELQHEEGGEEKHDLLSAIVRANMREEGKNRLTDQELLSDAYIFEVAGHETSSNALAGLFVLLALYPEHQEPIVDEVKAYLSSSPHRPFAYPEAYNSLSTTLATVQEGLRLVGPVAATSKATTADVVLEARTMIGEKRQIVVPAGVAVKEGIIASHYSPLDWPDPFEFKPSRFLSKDWDSESFVPFSSGLRGCIGKNFAMAEMVVLLALTLLRFRLEIPSHVAADWACKPGETERERRDRILKPSWPFTMGPTGIDIAFVPRETAQSMTAEEMIKGKEKSA